MEVCGKILHLMEERGWSEYRLAKKCGLSQSTIANILHRNVMPSIPTLETICSGMGITMSQFFEDFDFNEDNDEFRVLFDSWQTLKPGQKDAVLQLIIMMKNN